MSENEHPSLNVNQQLTQKTAQETLNTLNLQVQTIKEKVVSLKEQTSLIEAEFNSLDALTVLAGIEAKLDAFIRRYDAVLSKTEENLVLEREALQKLLGNAGAV